MLRSCVTVASAVGLLCSATAARAGDGAGQLAPADGDDEPAPPPGGEPGRVLGDHKGQFGLGLSFTSGYRFIKTWDADRYCGDRATAESGGGNAAYCLNHTPWALDVTLSYGATRRIDLILDLRLGLERDFGGTASDDGPRLRHYAPGVKFWLSSGAVNYFSTAQLAIDTTGYTDASGQDLGTDVRLRNANGLQVDFHPAYGVYAYFAEEVAFRRWLEGGVEFGAGLQARYP